jgi:glycosyltransferase involved in cell wall biosynthesis
VREPRPLVSIVTPSLDQGRFIGEALRSVEAQDYPRIEHIVVDGGSTDDTLEILRAHPSVRWVSEPDEGQSDAINKGFAIARGGVLAWLNADDRYLPGAVSAAVDALVTTGAALVHGGWRAIDEEGRVVREVPVREVNREVLLHRGNLIAQPAAFFTREAFEAVGGVDPRYAYAMDYDLWLKLAERYPVGQVDALLADFRLHGASKTGAHGHRFLPEVRRINRRHGGPFYSRAYVAELAYRGDWRARPWRLYDLVRRGDVAGILERGRRRLRRRRGP